MIRERIKFTAGWAEANLGPRSHVRVGDRLVPKAIDVDFPGVDGQPALRMALAVVDGRPQCRSLTIEATEDGREVMQLDLRAVKLAEFVEEVFGAFAKEVVEEDGGKIVAVMRAGADAEVQASAAMQRARVGRGNRKIDNAFLVEVAEVYKANRHKPLRAVVDAFGVSDRQASNYRKLAAEAGYLPKTTRGQKKFEFD